MATRVGLISDTHGLMRPEALRFLEGSDHILHAGDVGDAAVLDALGALAPVTAVRGNNDRDAWARAIPETVRLRFEDVAVYMLHDLAALDVDPAAEALRVVVAGHSHRAACRRQGGVLYVNPGSAGPRRFRLPVGVGELRIRGARVQARLVTLQAPPAQAARS